MKCAEWRIRLSLWRRYAAEMIQPGGMIATATGHVQTRSIPATRTDGPDPPTLVLLSGMGVPASSWFTAEEEPIVAQMMREPVFLAPGVADLTPVLAYDRAGIGGSAPPTAPRGLNEAVAELEAVLKACAPGPVVLLGHSIGGLIAFEFTRRFPGRVSGLTLLDSSHPCQAERLNAVRTPQQQRAQQDMEQEIKAGHPERWDFEKVFRRGGDLQGTLPDLPLLVISRGQPFLPEHLTTDEQAPFTPAQAGGFTREWNALQSELALASSQGRRVVATGSGHYPHFDEPRLVLREVRAFLETL
ncbi:alpha/beta hydrolase [Deinococcus seoulensis]|uniref:Alpha/beta hydrolase n=2 Tax=Deinococcus seoulensis TaxID=1837379 RepID=A0ABQ2RWW8_9DEIO|nr:alpha/beta hydrolase [Deinococcus seoulensis]